MKRHLKMLFWTEMLHHTEPRAVFKRESFFLRLATPANCPIHTSGNKTSHQHFGVLTLTTCQKHKKKHTTLFEDTTLMHYEQKLPPEI